MKKFYLFFFTLLFLVPALYAQRSISGTVKDNVGEPLIGANILAKGTSVGSISDLDGNFSLTVPAGTTNLVISFTGYESMDVNIEGLSTVDVILKEGKLLDEVVVTALGIKRSEKSLAYAAQSVDSEELNPIRQTNLNNALAGKIAGIQVRSQSSVSLGKDASIRIRGAASLVDKAPLYVLDGNPVGSADINMDDIENVTVLKGPAATALYGQRGDAGVVVMTSKRGSNKPGIGIEINQSTFFDNVYILPKYQNSYAGGGAADLIKFNYEAGMPEAWKALDGKYYHDYSDDASWGPRMIGQEYIPWYAWYPGTQYSYKTEKLLPQPNNIRNFYEQQISTNTNVNFSKSSDIFSTRISVSAQRQNGQLYNSSGNKYTISSQNSLNLGSHFIVGANINYMDYTINGQFDDAYSNQSTGSFNSWFHRDLDFDKMYELRDLRSAEGILASWNHNNPGAIATSPLAFYGGNYWYNFYSFFDQIKFKEVRRKLFGDASLTYKLNDKFKITGTFRTSNGNAFGDNSIPSLIQNSATQTGVKASYQIFQYYGNYINNTWKPNENNFELLANYTDRFADVFSVDLLVGGNLRKDVYRFFNSNTVDGLVVPDLFTLTNSVSKEATNSYRSKKEVRSMFARASFGFKDFLYIDGSIRNDISSALPVDANSYFYPSVGASLVFSELMKQDVLSYGKLRASWAQVGSDLDPYKLGLSYALGTDKFNGNAIMGTPNTIVDPNIKPALSSSFEAGFDLRFWRDRLGLSFTYFNENKIDEILSVPIAGASGFTNKLINAGKINRHGIELSLEATPIKTSNIAWITNLNFAKNTSTIDSLADGVNAIAVEGGASTFASTSGATTVHQVGAKWGQIRGGGFTYLNGQKVVGADGLFIANPNQYLGSVLPDFTGGWSNAFSFGRFTANANIEFSKGGKYFSLSDHWGSFSGLFERTAGVNDKGNPVRDPIADGGGVHVTGVTAEGKPVDTYVDAQTYYHQFRSHNIAEEHVYDLSFVKMRELSVGYNFPIKTNKIIQNVNISLVARNPWLIYAKNRDFDPSEISGIYGENGQFPGTRSFGFNIKLGF